MMYKLNSIGLIGLSSSNFAFSRGKDYEYNAALALAAPALLKALEAALKTAEFENHPFRPWHDQARAAIAAAKGE